MELDPIPRFLERIGCHENKCVSTGLSNLYNDSFTCYGDKDGLFFPMMCTDGYRPMATEFEPSYIVEDVDGSGKDVTLQHFTCCHPHYWFSYAFRKCSDPITSPMNHGDSGDNSMDAICKNNSIRQYPQKMRKRFLTDKIWDDVSTSSQIDSFLCCDEEKQPTDEKALKLLDCVPYHNRHYTSYKVQNRVGKLDRIFCDLHHAREKDFLYPRPIWTTDVATSWTTDAATAYSAGVATTGRYQCCRFNRYRQLPPFIEDSAFKITVWSLIALFCVGAIVSATLLIGLLTPLLIQIKNGSHQKRRSRERGRAPPYSTYNLYLVYLAYMDLVMMLWEITMFGSIINQSIKPFFLPPLVFPVGDIAEGIIVALYGCANMTINVIIAYEILVLIQTSHREKRIDPPSLKRVNLQAGTAIFISVIYAVIIFLVPKAFAAAAAGLIFLLTFGYILYVIILIWWRGYLQVSDETSVKDRAMRELALYFFRIVAVYALARLPSLIFAVMPGLGKSWEMFLAYCLMAVQPTLTFCLMLIKPDVRKYMLQLVTLYNLFGNCACKKDNAVLPKKENENLEDQDITKTSTTSSGTGHALEAAVAAPADKNIAIDKTTKFGITKTSKTLDWTGCVLSVTEHTLEAGVVTPADNNSANDSVAQDDTVEDDFNDDTQCLSLLGYTPSDFPI